MELRSASIIFFKGKFFIPSSVQSESGVIIDADPVYITDIDINQVERAVEQVMLSPRRRVPDLSREEWKKREDSVLIATGAKSWKELARGGVSYNIGWSDKQKRLDYSQVDKQGKWEFDPKRVQVFPVSTPLRTIVEIIIGDVQSRIPLSIN